MRVGVSACLLGQKCRYDGSDCKREKMMELLASHEVIPVCPECLAGFSVPREPIEIQNGRIISKSKKDLTLDLENGVQKAMQLLKEQEVEMVILKNKSPSCGANWIYDGNFCGHLVQGDGFFAKALKKNGFFILQVD